MERFSNIKMNWFRDGENLTKFFEFKDFNSSLDFVNKVATVANKLNHHPTILIDYNKVEIKTTTHDAGNIITEKDYQLCREIDKI